MLKNKKIIIFAEKEFEDLELLYPKLRLIEEGAEVIVAGLGALSSLSCPICSHITIAKVCHSLSFGWLTI